MKTEMKMMPNGNYESVISPLQHECKTKDRLWRCVEYGWDSGNIYLYHEVDENWAEKILVNYCPFCGYFSNVDNKF